MEPATTVTLSSASQDGSYNLATAVAVEKRPVVVADPVDKPNEEKKKFNTLAFVFVLVAIAVIVLAVVFSPSGKSKADVIPTESSESTQTTTEGVDGSEPSMQTEGYEQRRENMISVLESLYEDSEGGVAVFNASSPFASQDRIDALEWLVKLDKANLQPAIPSDFSEQEVLEYEQILYQVRQRFIMALLYTATNGQDWTQQCNFLSESNECEWRNINLLDETKGVTCNDAGQIETLQLWWIGLSGTLPHELSFFSESLIDINIPGGSISGPIPSSYEKLTNLKSLILADNCIDGDLPQGINHIDMPNLEILSIGSNNYGLTASSGNMETFCDGAGNFKEGVVALAIDCPVEEFGYDEFGNATSVPWGCDCCVCCFPEKYECQHPVWGSWTSYYLGSESTDEPPRGFQSQCISEQQVSWIAENCPCVISAGNPDDNDFIRECTTDCTRADAIPSYDFGS